MADFPYHVAGGAFTSSRLPLQLFDSVLNHPSSEYPDHPSRRRKLWDISHKCHCPIIGTCFDVLELRGLMKKVMVFPSDTTDFVLHTTAVGACETRTRLSELLQKQLEKRFQATIRRFAVRKDTTTLRHLWKDAVTQATEIPAALWATWSHPACDSVLEQEIYADIHMIQHQVASGNRADLKSLKAQRDENRELRQQLEKVRQENESLRAEKSSETQALGQRIVELRAEQTGRDARIASLSSQLEQLREDLPDLKDRQTLLRRANEAEARYRALLAHSEGRESEFCRLKERLDHAEEFIVQLSTDTSLEKDAPSKAIPAEKLSGKCILCVGGRVSAVDAYRQLVEQSGGRFIHHDGGIEESMHRIDGALTAADLVICQAGCISHNAYWRVKEQCKRTGKRCIFVRNSGVGSFGRVLDEAITEYSTNEY